MVPTCTSRDILEKSCYQRWPSRNSSNAMPNKGDEAASPCHAYFPPYAFKSHESVYRRDTLGKSKLRRLGIPYSSIAGDTAPAFSCFFLERCTSHKPTACTQPSRFLSSIPDSPLVNSFAMASLAPLRRALSLTLRSSFSHSLIDSTISSSSKRAS
jgi:hypothetical protein